MLVVRNHGWLFCLALLISLALPHEIHAQNSPDAAVAANLPVGHFNYLELPGLQAKRSGGSDMLRVDVAIDGKLKTLELRPHSMRAEGFEILVQTGPDTYVPMQAPEISTWRGTVVGEPGSTVAASLTGDGLSATLTGADESWLIEPARTYSPAADASLHVVYKQSDVKGLPYVCGIDASTESRFSPFKGLLEDPLFSAGGAVKPATEEALFCYKVCEIAIDADYDYFVLKGSDTAAVTAAIEEIINDVALIYERDTGITYSITTLIIRQTESDPYTATGASNLLDEMVDHWNDNHGSVTRDVAHLFTGREIDGSTVGIAYVGVICNGSFGYGLSQHIGGRSSRAGLTAHELGHNWNASHCSGEDCRIMCPSLGGCSGDVTRFGAASISIIESHRDSRGCLSDLCPGYAPEFTSDPLSKPDAPHNANYSQSLAGDVTDSDSSPAQLTFSKLSGPSWLTVASNGGLSGMPGAFSFGANEFTVQVTDNTGLTDVATLNITVVQGTSAPTAYNDSVSTDEDTPLIIDVLANDIESDGDTLEIVGVTQPANGAAAINPDETVTYTPDPEFVGVDVFSYTVTDNAEGQDTADVTVTVNGTGSAPEAVLDYLFTPINTAILVNPKANDTDADGDPLDVISITQPANGTAVLYPDDTVLYTPNTDFLGEDTFTYVVSDNRDGTDNSWVGVMVHAPHSAPTANPDSASTDEGQPVTIAVKDNDTDADGDGIDVISVTQPANGFADLKPDDTVIYTPNEFFVGEDTFDYVLTDAIDGSSTGTVTVTVNNTGTAPTAAADSDSMPQGETLLVDVLANDTDSEGDPLQIVGVGSPANGTAEITADNRIRYTPAIGFTGADSFTYTIEDPNDGQDSATATVTVHAPDADRGLVAWWTFETDSSDASVEGQDNSGANFGSPEFHVYGQVGGAMRMDGINDIIIVNDSPDINFDTHRRKAVTLWFNADDVTSGRQVLYREGDVTRGWLFYLDGGQVHMGAWNNVDWESAWEGTYFSAPVASGQWHHLAMVLDGIEVVTSNSLTAWLDGELLGSGDASQIWLRYGGTMIGHTPNPLPYHDGEAEGANYYAGLIDDVRVYNRTLGGLEIALLAQLYGNRRPMVLQSPVDLHMAEPGEPYNADVTGFVLDPDSDPVSFTKISGPDWVVVSPAGMVSGFPETADKGLVGVQVSIDDGEWPAETYLELNIQVGPPRSSVGSGWIMYD